MSDRQLQRLKQHVATAERKVRTRDDTRRNEIVENLRRYLTTAWQREVDAEESDSAAIRLFAAARLVVEQLPGSLAHWLARSIPAPASDFLLYVLQQDKDAETELAAVSHAGDESTIHLFERFLSEIDPRQRRRVGVFYTPRPIVQYIVRQTHWLLQGEFHLPDGLADIATCNPPGDGHDAQPREDQPLFETPMVRLLDPAVGTGVFLVESIEVIHQLLDARWRSRGSTEAEIRRRWNRYVAQHLLKRLTGVDLMPAPCLLAALNIVLKLARTGYEFAAPCPVNLYVADSLAGPICNGVPPHDSLPTHWRRALERAAAACQDTRSTVVLGNPPYAALSNSTSPWIEQLIRGRLPGDVVTGSYYEMDGQPLNERKLWLHDDYVKFLRFGQWKIEQAGFGILAFVTNHGYLDNPTFRGMRQQLASTFPRISLVDLHGNAKKKETSIDGRPDQNVFDVEQGIAIGLFRKLPRQQATTKHKYMDVWGTRETKYAWLRAQSESSGTKRNGNAEDLHPQAPYYFFVSRDNSLDGEYQRGAPLTEVFPVYASAVVTARDSFVIAFEKDELVRRIEAFRDLAISDDEIRNRYFNRTRSRKHAAGDTRGWKLTDARRRLANDDHWQDRIRHCQYRPFDKRYVFWSADMIDWPRTEVMRHFVTGDNLALVARRQMLPTQPCRYFWIADEVTIDGVIRSDNRGNETIFPLYLHDAQPRVNLHPDFVQSLARRFNLTWIESGGGDLHSALGPEAVIQYIYAMFHASEYRERYANQLRVEFPRVFFPTTVDVLRFFVEAGGCLIASHRTSQFSVSPPSEVRQHGEQCERPDTTLAAGCPKWKDERVYLNASNWFDGVTEEMWQFYAGGHQVLRKWLKDRRVRSLRDREMCAYREIVKAVRETLLIVARIDKYISSAGGWPRAFDIGRSV